MTSLREKEEFIRVVRKNCLKVLGSAVSMRRAIRDLAGLIERIERHPFYEFTKEDKAMLLSVTALMLTVFEVMHDDREKDDR